MSIQRISIIAILIILLFGGWKYFRWKYPNYPERFAENMIEFQTKESKLNELVILVNNEIVNQEIPNKRLDLDDISPLLREKMIELGFHKITILDVENPCSTNVSFSFEVAEFWNVDYLNNVEVIFSPCDEETIKGNHVFDGHHIDIWGAGNNWKIFTDTDFI